MVMNGKNEGGHQSPKDVSVFAKGRPQKPKRRIKETTAEFRKRLSDWKKSLEENLENPES